MSAFFGLPWVAILMTTLFCFYEWYQDFCCRKTRRRDSYLDIAEWMVALGIGIIAGLGVIYSGGW